MVDTTVIPELRRPLPNFEKWLDDHGHTERGNGFEALADLVRRTQDQTADGYNEDAKSLLRMWQGLSIAVVELCNIEHCKGRTPAQIIQLLPRALACAAFYSTASVLEEDSPWRSIAKILTEEFRFAVKEAADQHAERCAREREAV